MRAGCRLRPPLIVRTPCCHQAATLHGYKPFGKLAESATHASKVAYVTDVEGNWSYFLSWIEHSPGLKLLGYTREPNQTKPSPTTPNQAPLNQANQTKPSKPHTLCRYTRDGAADIWLAPEWRVVFGGDVCDKGPKGGVGGSVRVARSLLALKAKYDERVTLILGNRDVNKLRLASELDATTHHLGKSANIERLRQLPGPYWVKEKSRVTPVAYLTKLVAAQKASTGGSAELIDVSDEPATPSDRSFHSSRPSASFQPLPSIAPSTAPVPRLPSSHFFRSLFPQLPSLGFLPQPPLPQPPLPQPPLPQPPLPQPSLPQPSLPQPSLPPSLHRRLMSRCAERVHAQVSDEELLAANTKANRLRCVLEEL